jgi:hypothetical protein
MSASRPAAISGPTVVTTERYVETETASTGVGVPYDASADEFGARKIPNGFVVRSSRSLKR